ncbi:MAG: DUF882 domain-containing protein [Polyangiaceae bacterium]|nr:DUF882 domain-containing protein [Polyangiaceae bacterium]
MRWLSHIVVLVALCVAAPAWAQTQAKSVRHTVKRGETLSSIAAQYGTNVASICRWNGIKPTVVLAPGRKIGVPLPPGARPPVAPGSKAGTQPAASAGGSWSDYIQTPKRPGYLTLKSYTQSWEGHVVTRSGKILPAAQRGVETVLSSWRTDSEKPIHPRLVKLIVQVSDVFGGRPIRVVSGYREPRNNHGKNSRHALGHAIDFQIEGVPNWAVVEYLRTLDQVGVGYYPNSHHVHLDVREQTTHWVDVSGPGQRARYVKPKAQPARGKRQVARSTGSRAR